MKRQYVNKNYYDIETGDRSQRNLAGTRVKMKVDLKRGTVEKPKLTWVVERQASEDDLYIRDPDFTGTVEETTSWGRAVDRHWMTLKIDKVLGAKYTVSVKLDGVTKHTFDPFETWLRVYLNVKADNQRLYDLFSSALSRVKAMFARAYIVVEENTVTVANVEKKTKDLSQNGDKGERVAVNLKDADWYAFSHNAEVKFEDGAVKSPGYATLEGTDLKLVLNEICRWKESPAHLTEVTASAGSDALATVRDADVLARAVSRVDNRTMRIRLADESLDAVRAAVVARRAVTLKLSTGIEQFGRDGGQGMKGTITLKFWRAEDLTLFNKTQDTATLAALIAHELGHSFGLTKNPAKQRHKGTRNVYEYTERGAQPARVATDTAKYHKLKHGPDFGGSGEHCQFNTRKVEDPSTSSRQRVARLNGMKSCAMYRADLDEVMEGGFCDTCLAFLRRMPGA